MLKRWTIAVSQWASERALALAEFADDLGSALSGEEKWTDLRAWRKREREKLKDEMES